MGSRSEASSSRKTRRNVFNNKHLSHNETRPFTSKATSKSDVMISIKPILMDHLVTRSMDHEFRNYFLSPSVERIWFYVSSPQQSLRYIARIGPAKKPGEISNEHREWNVAFNAGRGHAKFAYEILELYEVVEPVKLRMMKEKYSTSFPQRFAYIPKNLLEDIVPENQLRIF